MGSEAIKVFNSFQPVTEQPNISDTVLSLNNSAQRNKTYDRHILNSRNPTGSKSVKVYCWFQFEVPDFRDFRELTGSQIKDRIVMVVRLREITGRSWFVSGKGHRERPDVEKTSQVKYTWGKTSHWQTLRWDWAYIIGIAYLIQENVNWCWGMITNPIN